MIANRARLGSNSVLVGEDTGGGRVGRVGVWRTSVDGGYDREVVLVSPEVGVSDGKGAVERVLQRRVKGTERELVDHVREVEGWSRQNAVSEPISCTRHLQRLMEHSPV